MNVVRESERRTDVIERKLTTVREVLDSFFPDNGEEDAIFNKEAAEAHIRELAAKPEAVADQIKAAVLAEHLVCSCNSVDNYRIKDPRCPVHGGPFVGRAGEAGESGTGAMCREHNVPRPCQFCADKL
jgi:hypothetical protein